jgi:TolA-binding protein
VRLLTLSAAALLAASACATDAALKAELVDLRREVRAQRETGRRLAERLDRLEASQAVIGARDRAADGRRPAASEVPELAVVRLKPKAEPPPKLDTRRAVQEPPAELDEEAFAPAAGLSGAPESGDAEADAAIGEALFEEGLSALKTGNLEGGVARLKAFVGQYPRHARADNALFFMGVGLQGLDNLPAAVQAFQSVLEGYPAGDAVLDALLRLADCRARMGQQEKSRQLYIRIVQQYPGTTAAARAQVALRPAPAGGDVPAAGP